MTTVAAALAVALAVALAAALAVAPASGTTMAIPGLTQHREWDVRPRPREGPLAPPPGILFNATALAMFAVAVWRGSERSGVLDSILLIAAAWFFVLLAWLFRLVASAGERTITVRSMGRWVLAPALFMLAGVLVFNDQAMDARFALSRSALDEVADAALDGRDVPGGWVGLYPVRSVLVEGGSVSFAIDGQYAFVRDPSGGSDSVVWFEPMGGRWSMEIVASFGD